MIAACRATGEGVGPQEYTLIKMRVLELHGPLAALEGQSGLSNLFRESGLPNLVMR